MKGSVGASAVVGMLALAAGCAVTRPDVEGDAARMTGVTGAIVFREGGAAAAMDAAPGDSLSMEQAVRLCLEHDPRIQGALAKVRMAEADAHQARLLPNPIVSVDLRFPTEPGTGRTIEGTLTEDLLSLLQKPGQIGAADKRLREASCQALTTVLDVMEEVEESYAAAAALDEGYAGAAARLDVWKQMQTMAEQRQKAGDAGRADTLAVQTQLAQAEADAQDLGVQMYTERLHLARLIGSARGTILWKLGEVELPAEEAGGEEAWVEAAVRNRPEVQGKVWELRALGDDLTAAEYSPLVGGDVGAHAEHDPRWRVGPEVAVPVPMFDWGQANRAKIRASRVMARADLEETEAEVVQNVRTAWRAYVASREAVAEVEKIAAMQGELRDLAKRAYQAGEGEMTPYLMAQTDLGTTEGKVLDLREKAVAARGQLMRAAGGAGVGAGLMTAATEPSSQPATRPN